MQSQWSAVLFSRLFLLRFVINLIFEIRKLQNVHLVLSCSYIIQNRNKIMILLLNYFQTNLIFAINSEAIVKLLTNVPLDVVFTKQILFSLDIMLELAFLSTILIQMILRSHDKISHFIEKSTKIARLQNSSIITLSICTMFCVNFLFVWKTEPLNFFSVIPLIFTKNGAKLTKYGADRSEVKTMNTQIKYVSLLVSRMRKRKIKCGFHSILFSNDIFVPQVKKFTLSTPYNQNNCKSFHTFPLLRVPPPKKQMYHIQYNFKTQASYLFFLFKNTQKIEQQREDTYVDNRCVFEFLCVEHKVP